MSIGFGVSENYIREMKSATVWNIIIYDEWRAEQNFNKKLYLYICQITCVGTPCQVSIILCIIWVNNVMYAYIPTCEVYILACSWNMHSKLT